MKKLLAMVLALVMTLSLAVSANAAFKDVKDIDETYAESAAVLNGLGVFKGYEEKDGTFSFQPKNAITRAEVAAIVYRIYTGDVKDAYVKNYETYNKFGDMAGAGWAKGYIGYCANAALVKGYPNGTFVPSGKVTGYEVLAMILRAVGYDQKNEFTGADWALHVAEIAERQGILDNVKGVDLNAPATREVVAELLFQAIQVPMVTYTAAFGYQNVSLNEKADNKIFAKNKTLGDAFNLASYEGYITYNAKKEAMVLTEKGEKDADDVIITVADQDVFDAGRYGHVWATKTTAITDVFYDDSLLATKYESWNTDWTTKNKTDFIAKEGDMNYFLNGKEVKAADIEAALKVKGSEKAIYDIDDDGDIDTVIVINPIVDVMTADYLAKNDKVKIQGKTFDKDEVSGYEELAKDDVFTYVDMVDGVRYFEELTAIAGQKSAYNEPSKADPYITFDSKDYEQSGLKGTSDEASLFTKIKSTFDKDGYIYVDRGGFVVYTSWDKAAAAYAMVIDAYSVLSDKHDDIEYYVNLLLTDGTETGYVRVDHDKYRGDIEFENVAAINYNKTYTGSPKATGNYEDLGVLVKYTVKDGVYTLTDAAETDGAELSSAYVQGAATMKIANKNYAVTDGSIVFYQYKEETAADKFTAHYGVNVGKYDAKNNETGIPGYYEGVDVDYLETDKDDDEVLEAAVLGYLPAVWYDDYAYIYDYTKTTTTGSKLDIYTYYGVNLNGEVIEFSAYKQLGQNAINGKDVVGNVVWYAKDHNDLYDFGWYDSTLSSLKLMGNTNTVKAREEGKNTDWDTFMNANVVYDLTDTDKLEVGKTAPVYTFYWDKTAQAAVVYKDHNDDNNDVAIVECAFVVDDTVKYGEFKVDGAKYWYPVETETGDAIKYTLKDLDDAFNAAKYHITDKAGKTELIANDAKFAFAANDEYSTVKHTDAVVGTITAVTGTLSADGKTLTVPYGTEIATTLINAPGADVKVDGSKLVLTYKSATCDCTTVVEINVVVTAAVYSVTLEQSYNATDAETELTVQLSTDAQLDVDNGGKIIVYKSSTSDGAGAVYWDSSIGGGEITTKTSGYYYAVAFNSANEVIGQSAHLFVPNDGTIG